MLKFTLKHPYTLKIQYKFVLISTLHTLVIQLCMTSSIPALLFSQQSFKRYEKGKHDSRIVFLGSRWNKKRGKVSSFVLLIACILRYVMRIKNFSTYIYIYIYIYREEFLALLLNFKMDSFKKKLYLNKFSLQNKKLIYEFDKIN